MRDPEIIQSRRLRCDQGRRVTRYGIWLRCRFDRDEDHRSKYKNGVYGDDPMQGQGQGQEEGMINILFDRLSPGAHLFAIVSEPLAYGRIACAIEDAGFEIRDCIMYLYTSLPRKEVMYIPICVARKPLDGTVCQNVIKYGCGGLNIDGTRIGVETRTYRGMKRHLAPSPWSDKQTVRPEFTVTGRWPSNIMHDGSEIVVNAFPLTAKAGNKKDTRTGGGSFGHLIKMGRVNIVGDEGGSAARFFHCAPTMADVVTYLWKMIGE